MGKSDRWKWSLFKKGFDYFVSATLVNILFVFSLLALASICIIIGADVHSQLKILNCKDEFIELNSLTSKILSFFITKVDGKFSVHQSEAALKILLDSAVCLVTVFVVFHPFIARYKAKLDMKKKHSIQLKRVIMESNDDITLMEEHYKDADFVYVYSGDFSWLNADTALKRIVIDLATSSKIKLVSNKEKAIVEAKMGSDLFKIVSDNGLLKYIDDKPLRCSLINKRGMNTLLYLTVDESDVDKLYMCIVSGKNESRFILNAMEMLMEKVWSHPPKDHHISVPHVDPSIANTLGQSNQKEGGLN